MASENCESCTRYRQFKAPGAENTFCFRCYPYQEVVNNESWIRSQIFTKKGIGTLKASLSSSSVDPISYYVWRMARFHGGADVTLPIQAVCGLDKRFADQLDTLVTRIAVETFGTGMKAAMRWGKALGWI